MTRDWNERLYEVWNWIQSDFVSDKRIAKVIASIKSKGLVGKWSYMWEDM